MVCLATGLLWSCQPSETTEQAPEHPLFEALDSAQTGVTFVNHLEYQEDLNILDYLYFYNGAGVAVGDVNGDGKNDLYFVSNRQKNKLYLNRSTPGPGNLRFEDATEAAGVGGYSDWQTGVTMADVNGDGWLDIYLCAVANFRGLEGANELYINDGPDETGQVTFTERSAEYGVDFSGFATQAAFFDYDHDGDLDLYLLNHAVHTSRSYDRVSTRALVHQESGDRLYKNQLQETGRAGFVDVSEQAGIYQAAMGYGLGVSVADLNNDGWDDIYVSNDFHEDDYYYVNNGDGTFTERARDHFRHLSRYSMGNDVGDLNGDGYQDVLTLDMYPEDEVVEKSSLGEDPFDIYRYKLDYGYFYQYSRNCLQLNMGGEKFADVGAMAGMAATDWSWSTLLADYDLDGRKDIFVSNGIVHRPNNLEYVKFASGDSLRYAMETSTSLDQRAIAMMPEGKTHNYLFQGTDSLRFHDRSVAWGLGEPNISNGAAYADLDGDGDLDLIINNINEPAHVYENQTNTLGQPHYLRVQLKGTAGNTYGVGAKVILKSGGKLQLQQLMPTRGFLSAVEPTLTFGLGTQTKIDTLLVCWEDQRTQLLTDVPIDTTLILHQTSADGGRERYQAFFPKPQPLFEDVTPAIPVDYVHHENQFFDFYRESLIPFHVSTEGPRLAVGDVNGDSLDDFFVGGAKWQAGQLFVQTPQGGFNPLAQPAFRTDSTYEDVGAAFFDADGDGDLDLYVVSGGNEFYDQMPEQYDRLYLNDGQGHLTRATDHLPPMPDNTGCVRPFDVDGDGDLDLFVGGRVVSYHYGASPRSYLLVNDGTGHFSDRTEALAPDLQRAGLVSDAVWVDYDRDGDGDLILAGDWMPIRVFRNEAGKLTEATEAGLSGTEGLWASLTAADFDGDGDLDLMAGNLGLNTKLRKTEGTTLKMYVKDLDGNETLDQILTYNVGDRWYTVATKDELGKQLPGIINKRFTSYKDFAGKTVDEIFTADELNGADVLEVNEFRSLYLENTGTGSFITRPLPEMAQVSKIYALHPEDADGDGNLDVLLGGNYHGVSVYQGRYDGSYGLMLKGDGKGHFTSVLPTDCGFLLEGEVRDIQSIRTTQGSLLLIARNGLPLQLFRPMQQEPSKAMAHAGR